MSERRLSKALSHPPVARSYLGTYAREFGSVSDSAAVKPAPRRMVCGVSRLQKSVTIASSHVCAGACKISADIYNRAREMEGQHWYG